MYVWKMKNFKLGKQSQFSQKHHHLKWKIGINWYIFAWWGMPVQSLLKRRPNRDSLVTAKCAWTYLNSAECTGPIGSSWLYVNPWNNSFNSITGFRPSSVKIGYKYKYKLKVPDKAMFVLTNQFPTENFLLEKESLFFFKFYTIWSPCLISVGLT